MTKLKNKDVLIINESLMYLSSKGTGAWYGVSKNLRKIKVVVAEINASKDSILENLSKKGKDGKPMFEGEGQDRKVVWIDEKKADKQWNELMNEDAAEVDWFPIPEAKFEGSELDALLIEPLLDVIIVD